MASQYLQRIDGKITDVVALSQWNEKKHCWLIDKKEGFLQASIVSEDGNQAEVLLEDGTV